jgi:hypothetical protein
MIVQVRSQSPDSGSFHPSQRPAKVNGRASFMAKSERQLRPSRFAPFVEIVGWDQTAPFCKSLPEGGSLGFHYHWSIIPSLGITFRCSPTPVLPRRVRCLLGLIPGQTRPAENPQTIAKSQNLQRDCFCANCFIAGAEEIACSDRNSKFSSAFFNTVLGLLQPVEPLL